MDDYVVIGWAELISLVVLIWLVSFAWGRLSAPEKTRVEYREKPKPEEQVGEALLAAYRKVAHELEQPGGPESITKRYEDRLRAERPGRLTPQEWKDLEHEMDRLNHRKVPADDGDRPAPGEPPRQ